MLLRSRRSADKTHKNIVRIANDRLREMDWCLYLIRPKCPECPISSLDTGRANRPRKLEAMLIAQ